MTLPEAAFASNGFLGNIGAPLRMEGDDDDDETPDGSLGTSTGTGSDSDSPLEIKRNVADTLGRLEVASGSREF